MDSSQIGLPLEPVVLPQTVTKYYSRYTVSIALVVVGLLFFAKSFLKRIKSSFQRYLKLNAIQGPLAIPFIATVDLIRTPYEGLFEKFNGYCKQFPGCFKLWVLQQPTIVVHSKENVRRILGSPDHLKKPEYYEVVLNSVFGRKQGLLVADVDKWKDHRKVLTPAVNGRILEDFLDITNEESLKFCRAIGKEILTKLKERNQESNEMSKIPVDMRQIFHNLFMGMILEAVVGVREDFLEGSPDAPFTIKTGDYVKNMFLARSMNPLLRYDWIWRFHPLAKPIKEMLDDAHAWYRKSIAARRAQLKKEDENDHVKNINGKRFRRAVLDTLLELSKDPKNEITDEYLAYEMNTFVLGGHDTTSETISIVVYMLAIYPEFQEKVYQEILQVFGDDKDRPATLADLSHLTYMEQFVRETQRMFPVVPMVMRETGCDVVLEEGYTIPAGSTVAVWGPGLHRDPRVFPNPDEFDPEHFSEEAFKNVDQYAYVPYSGGLRNCIGKRLAVIQLKVVLSRLLLHYKLVGADPKCLKDVRWLPRVIMCPSNRFRYYLEERT